MHPGGALVLLAILAAALLLLRSFWERRQLRVESYRFPAAVAEPCRVVFLSDLHSEQFGAGNQRLIQAVQKLSPDLLLVGGDMITCGKKSPRPPRTGTCVHLMEALSQVAPIVYAEGNHELRMGTRFPENYTMFVQHLEQIPGLTYLHDAQVTMETGLKKGMPVWQKAVQEIKPERKKKAAQKMKPERERMAAQEIKPEQTREAKPAQAEEQAVQTEECGAGKIICTGISMEQAYYDALLPGFGRKRAMPESYLEQKLEKAGQERKPADEASSAYRILLLHSPLYLKESAAAGADLVLSGHFHGGTIRIPGLGGLMTPQYQFFVKECAGSFQEGKTRMLVSRGLGTHSIRIRLNDLPEISCIDLQPNRDGHCVE